MESITFKAMYTNSNSFLKSVIWYLVENEFTATLKGAI